MKPFSCSHRSPNRGRRELILLAALAGLAVVLAIATPAVATPLGQDSTVAPQQDVSPLPTPTAPIAPTAGPTATAAPTPAPATPPGQQTAEPPIPAVALATIMAVIGVVALIIGLRRK